MTNPFQEDYAVLNTHLQHLKEKYQQYIVYSNHAYRYLRPQLDDLAIKEINYNFESIEHEIHYYKNNWFDIHRKYYKYQILQDIMPVKLNLTDSISNKIRPLCKEFNAYLKLNRRYVRYHKLKSTHRDHIYFSKTGNEKHILAKIVSIYQLMENPLRFFSKVQTTHNESTFKKLIYQRPKVNLLALAYVLHRDNEEQGGAYNLIDYTRALELVFDVKFKNPYDEFKRSSHKNKVEYLKSLSKHLDDIIEEIERYSK